MVATHAIAATVSSFLWVVMAITLVTTLDLNPSSDDLVNRFSNGAVPLFVFGVLIYLLVVALHYVLLAFETSREAERREMELRVLAGEAELKAVRAQLSPHFLFNSLNSVSALTTADPAKAREMCVLFADLLRSSLGVGEKPSISLSEELTLARSFLTIERIRFGPRLDIEEDMDVESARCAVPPLLLQPLVENAVTHGIATRLQGGTVSIRTKRSGETVTIAIENPFDEEGKSVAGTGVGLQSVKRRLAARYGTRASLTSLANGGSFRVEIRLPVEAV
jgi:LytS/YehU family sensor histidine kinase